VFFLLSATNIFSQINCDKPVPPANQENCLVQSLKIDFLVEEYKKLFDQDIHAVIGSVVPGSGVSGGVGYTHDWTNSNHSPTTKTTTLDVRVKVSASKYWEVDSNLGFNFAKDLFGAQRDRQFNLYGIVRDLPRLDFYGIGPESRKQDHVVFHYHEAVVGFDGRVPIKKQLDLGGTIEGILPHITPITDPSVRSVERVFGPALAPGIGAQAPTLHLAVFGEFHGKGQQESWRTLSRLSYHLYQDLRDGTYSFRRFDADLIHKFCFGTSCPRKGKSKQNKTPEERMESRVAFTDVNPGQTELRLRGRVSFTDVGSGKVVPFYLMRTLGGSDISGAETLRGFVDYRFRDKDMVLVQAEFLKPLYGPIDLIVFNDTGKVAPSLKRFNVGRLRDTFGIGLAIVPSQLHAYLFRFYIALGSGEGYHITAAGGDPTAVGTRLFR
jgi:hypothetical protein